MEEPIKVNVYPNPTSSAFNLVVYSTSYSQKVKANVFDLQGRLVKTFTFNSDETISFGNELKSGVYLIEVIEGGKSKTVRVVKY
jgi:hypothetical protein